MSVGAAERTLALQAASLALGYPDTDLFERIPLLRSAADRLPPAAGRPLARFLGFVERTPAAELAVSYVDTFDLRRRCAPYLTYFSHGDTRKRGMALLRFIAAYRAAGFTLADDELPDHLAVVCEFAARAPQAGLPLFAVHRAGLELLRMALAEAGSPYADVLDVIRAVLPDPVPRDLDRALALARSGPPAEEVGLEPFAPPEYMGGARR